jgi:hypothetical protein
MTRPHYAGGPIVQSTQVHEYQVVFTDLASSGFETSDRRILPNLLPQLECATPAPYKMDSLLTEGHVQYAGLTEEVSV